MLAGSARVSMPRDRLVCVCFRGNLVADSEKRDRETLLQRSFQRAATKKGYYFDGVQQKRSRQRYERAASQAPRPQTWQKKRGAASKRQSKSTNTQQVNCRRREEASKPARRRLLLLLPLPWRNRGNLGNWKARKSNDGAGSIITRYGQSIPMTCQERRWRHWWWF